MADKKFQRQDANRHLRLGAKRKKKQTWRRPDGRHSKMRTRRKSYPARLGIGYKSPRSTIGIIEGYVPVRVFNVKDLDKVGKGQAAIVAKIGAKKKMELIKVAKEKNIVLLNVKEKKVAKEKTQ